MTPKRPNKLAQGMTKNEERHKKYGLKRPFGGPLTSKYNSILLDLIVKGTTCSLNSGNMYLIKRIKVEHPIDRGYFKEVYILNDNGRAKLKRLRYQKERRLNNGNTN